ncbi:hypothetical protein OS493_029267 [Desmophyllum pertusum]|uniref:Uncharacterized protein n=1 Tax=Desmophyllum pertusum TaxID=174260 RepID=A0A9W9ZKD9_9CNID|nr:hypothetical protein OS493_029267 [Desmophyllum pertusum]
MILKKSALTSAIDCLPFTVGLVATLISVVTLLYTGHPVTPGTAFMLLAFVNVLRRNLSLRLAGAIPNGMELNVSLRRIENFLLSTNLPFVCKEHGDGNTQIFGGEFTEDGGVYPLLLQKDSCSRKSLEQNDLPIQRNNICDTSSQPFEVPGSQLLISGATYVMQDPVKENHDEIKQEETIQPQTSAKTSESVQPEKLEISEEDRDVGNISFELYWEYFRSGIYPIAIVALIVFFIASQDSSMGFCPKLKSGYNG